MTEGSLFNPEAFLDATVSEPNEKRPPLPVENPAAADGLYTAVIGEIKAKTGTIGKGERIGQPWISMNIPLQIEVPQQIQDGLKLQPQLTVYDTAFLDLTPTGTLDNAPGRNRRQKMYREACNLNKPGDVFSWRKLQGQVVKVKLQHKLLDDGTPTEEVSAVIKMS